MLSGVERARRNVTVLFVELPLGFAFQPGGRQPAEDFDPERVSVQRSAPWSVGQGRPSNIFPGGDGGFWTADARPENTAALTPDAFLIGRVGWAWAWAV